MCNLDLNSFKRYEFLLFKHIQHYPVDNILIEIVTFFLSARLHYRRHFFFNPFRLVKILDQLEKACFDSPIMSCVLITGSDML